MSEVQDDFEPSFPLEGTDEGMENTSSNIEEIETNPKLSISKKAAKKRDARRRIEDYLELKRMKEVMEDYENRDIQLDSLNWYEGTSRDNHVGKK